jgi:hypothetical protein
MHPRRGASCSIDDEQRTHPLQRALSGRHRGRARGVALPAQDARGDGGTRRVPGALAGTPRVPVGAPGVVPRRERGRIRTGTPADFRAARVPSARSRDGHVLLAVRLPLRAPAREGRRRRHRLHRLPAVRSRGHDAFLSRAGEPPPARVREVRPVAQPDLGGPRPRCTRGTHRRDVEPVIAPALRQRTVVLPGSVPRVRSDPRHQRRRRGVSSSRHPAMATSSSPATRASIA